MYCASVFWTGASCQQLPFSQGIHCQGNMGFGDTTFGNNVGSPVKTGIVEQKQKNVQFILGQRPAFTDRLQISAVMPLCLSHQIQIVTRVHVSAPPFSSFLNNYSITPIRIHVNANLFNFERFVRGFRFFPGGCGKQVFFWLSGRNHGFL